MPTARSDPFSHAVHTANIWLADVAAAFGTRDRRYAHRAVRAWLHGLRDRLTVDASAKFGAQLPELLRGVFYDGWEPSRVPRRYTVDHYIDRFAIEAGVPVSQVPMITATVTIALADHFSPGQLEETFAGLPADLRTLLTEGALEVATHVGPGPVPSATRAGRAGELRPGRSASRDRLARLEAKVGNLTDAVRSLAHGLEDGELGGVGSGHLTRAARLADEIVLAGDLGPMP